MSRDDCIRMAEEIEPLSAEEAGQEFLDFYRHHQGRIGTVLLKVKTAFKRVDGLVLRSGMMPPAQSVIHEKIRGLCLLPYRTDEGTVPSCPGILEGWKGFPPHSPQVEETTDLLSRGRSLLVIQFEGKGEHGQQANLHRFLARLSGLLRKEGYTVLSSYACGPCRVCGDGCDESVECRAPEKRIFALESCGFWINRLCRMAAKHPICGGGPKEVQWIRDWGLPT